MCSQFESNGKGTQTRVLMQVCFSILSQMVILFTMFTTWLVTSMCRPLPSLSLFETQMKNPNPKFHEQVWCTIMWCDQKSLLPGNKVLSRLEICKICKYCNLSFPHQTEHGWESRVAKVATGAFRTFSLPLTFEHAGESPVSWVHIQVAKTLFWLKHKIVNCFNSLAHK